MNVTNYIDAGYNLSQHISQAVIDRAENDVLNAYILPIKADADESEYKAVVMELSYLLIMQRSLFATRSGGKEKQTAQSVSADRRVLLEQYSGACQAKLQAFAESVGVSNFRKLIDDRVCGIYFSTYNLAM